MKPVALLQRVAIQSETVDQIEFLDTYRAFDELPPDKRDMIELLHVARYCAGLQPRTDSGQDPQPLSTKVDWSVEGIRTSLTRTFSAVLLAGREEMESHVILAALRAWMTQSQYICRTELWSGDLAIWDCTGIGYRAVVTSRVEGAKWTTVWNAHLA